MTRTIGGLDVSTLCAQRHCHDFASPHQWPTQEPCHVNHNVTDACCRPKGTKQPFSGQSTCELWEFVHVKEHTVYVKLFNKTSDIFRDLVCFQGCVACKRKAKRRNFTHINPIKSPNKEIPSSPSKIWAMQTFAPVYGMIIIYATS